MQKIAEIITELQPHQKRALARALAGNLVLAHGTGSGKTLTSIAIADSLNKPAVALTPASLVQNYLKEIAKHKKGGPEITPMSLPTAVSQNYQIPEGSTLIIDEAHSLRNEGTARQRYIQEQAKRAGRVIGLTGTPAYNNIADWAPLVNVVAGKNVVPADKSRFYKRYISDEKISPGIIDRYIRGVKDGTLQKLTHSSELGEKLRPYVDIFEADVEKPRRVDEVVHVPMSKSQEEAYQLVQKKLPLNIIYKLFHNIPPSKSEAKSLNSFLSGVRQVSNTAEAYTTKQIEPGTKIKRIVEDVEKERAADKHYRALIYSNFLESGIDSVGKQFDARNIPYNRFTGDLTPLQKKRIVDEYNSGKVPIILGSGSASEGLDLKGTKAIKLVEPHFNNSRLRQVIGRGIRYKSHEDLPPEEREVRVTSYLSSLSPSSYLFGLIKKPRTSVDEYLTTRAAEKDALSDQVKNALLTEE